MSFSGRWSGANGDTEMSMVGGIREALGEYGIAKVGDVLSTDQLLRVRRWLEARESIDDELVESLQPTFDISSDGQRRLGRIRRLFWSDPKFWADILVHSRTIKIVSAVVGPSAALLFHSAFMKPSNFGSAAAVHQDQAIWPWELPGAITMWIAVTPSKLTNGCLVGYPGSHRGGLIGHVLMDGSVLDRSNGAWPRSIPSIPMSTSLGDERTAYELEPGEAVVWHRYFVHGSAENKSMIDRKGIALVFVDPLRPDFQRPDFDYANQTIQLTSLKEIADRAPAIGF